MKRFEDFVETDFERVDDLLGIKYQKQEIFDDTLLLLRYNCPDESCDIACLGWPDLHHHVRKVHHKVMCDLCTRNKKVFTHEHELYTLPELRKHERFGDDTPGAVDQSGFKGHPECGFCRLRFYGDDELFAHCRDKHERCHVCDRRNDGRQPQYYIDYNALEQHFRKDHFLCYDQDCLDKKFVVFESEMDLKGHQLENHPNGLSKDARRDTRRVDLSAFDYRTPHQDNQGRRGRGRGRDPNSEPVPPPPAQALRRDEIAYQRQMAIQSAQSIAPRSFGGHLTQSARSQEPSTNRRTTNNSTPLPSLDQLNLNPPNSSDPTQTSQVMLTPQEQARRLQHNAVMERAAHMLKGDGTKVSEFRNRVSSYRSSAITATRLIDSFFTIFDVSPTDLGKLVKELADIYESESKRADLLKAWNDWRAINEDYPDLPGPAGISPSTSAGSGGRRILKLKSSTAQSSRSATNQQRSWGNTTVTAASSNPFPRMPPPLSNNHQAGPSPKPGSAAPWGPSPAAAFSTPSIRSIPKPPNSPVSNTFLEPAPASDSFPSLPAAAKPNTHIFGLHRGSVKWDDRSKPPPANPWGGGNGIGSSVNASGAASEVEADDDTGVGGGAAKKKGKKKQTLYKFG